MFQTKIILFLSLLVIFGSLPQLYAFTLENHVAMVQWEQANYPVKNIKAKVIIDEPDMNKYPQSIDRFDIKVFSDSDNNGITVRATETSVNSGIFEANVIITNDPSKENRLHAMDGDTITAKYIDATLPKDQTSKELEITGTAFAGSTGPPLERAPAYDMKVYNTKGNPMDEISLDQQVEITANLQNSEERTQKFAYLVQIQNEKEETVSLSWIDGILEPLQTLTPAISWIPNSPGSYTATVFVWESVDNPTALSPPISMDLRVAPKLFDIKKFNEEPFAKITLVDYLYSYSKKKPIEFGINLEGYGYDLHPPKITIKDKKGEVFWSNTQFTERTTPEITKDRFNKNYSVEELGGPLKLPIGNYILTATFENSQIQRDLLVK